MVVTVTEAVGTQHQMECGEIHSLCTSHLSLTDAQSCMPIPMETIQPYTNEVLTEVTYDHDIVS